MKFYNTSANINDNIHCDKNMIQSLTKILNFQTSKAALYMCNFLPLSSRQQKN